MRTTLLQVLTVLFLVFTGDSFGQVETDLKNFKEDGKPTTWATYYSSESVTIEYKFVTCTPTSGLDNEGVVFKYTNKTNSKVILNWHLHLYYDETCRTCDFGDEYSKEISLTPNQIIEGNCTTEGDYTLKIFSKFNDANYSKGAKLTSFKLDNLLISTY